MFPRSKIGDIQRGIGGPGTGGSICDYLNNNVFISRIMRAGIQEGFKGLNEEQGVSTSG